MNSNQISLNDRIRDLINEVYCCCYNKRLETNIYYNTEGNPTDYVLKLYLHDLRWSPLTMAFSCSNENEFLAELELDLKKRNLIRSEHYKVMQLNGDN